MRRVCFIALLATIATSRSYSQVINYAVHANIIYHFTKYIDWPESNKAVPFIIGIVGETPLFIALTNFVADKLAGERKIEVKMYSNSEAVYRCQILYISDDESTNLKKILIRIAGAPVLIVTESEGYAHKGSCINFSIVFDRVKIEINKNNIELRHLNIASELLQLGKQVK